MLDIAGGSGDLSKLFRKKSGCKQANVILTDINASMLAVGRDRMLDAGLNVPAMQCNAEALPFADAQFDCVIVAFGLAQYDAQRHCAKRNAARAQSRRPTCWC